MRSPRDMSNDERLSRLTHKSASVAERPSENVEGLTPSLSVRLFVITVSPDFQAKKQRTCAGSTDDPCSESYRQANRFDFGYTNRADAQLQMFDA